MRSANSLLIADCELKPVIRLSLSGLRRKGRNGKWRGGRRGGGREREPVDNQLKPPFRPLENTSHQFDKDMSLAMLGCNECK